MKTFCAVALTFLMASCCVLDQPKPIAEMKSPPAEITPPPKVKVELYTMSKCPYCGEIMQDLAPALKNLAGAVEFRIAFVGRISEQGELVSLHGPEEVEGDLVELCVQTLSPAALPEFLKCVGSNRFMMFVGWNDCAKMLEIDEQAVKTCVEGNAAKESLRASFLEAKSRGVRGTPTLFIDNLSYEGDRTPEAFVKSLCEAAKFKPSSCAGASKPIETQKTE
jgi:hypothetical protein